MKERGNPPIQEEGFTLVELVIVIATITVLSGLMIPAFARAKIKSPAAGCLSNLRQMMVGWAMYRDDNNDVLLPNSPAGTSNSGWVNSLNGNEGWGFLAGNTNAALLQQGALAPYVQYDTSIYKCPGDVVPSSNGQRLRSYSMNGQMGAFYISAQNNFDAPGLTYSKGTDLVCPKPANAFIFCDEHPGSINDGYLQVDTYNGSFPDLPAAYLGGACGFSFADGHSEIHKWITTALTSHPVVFGLTVSLVVGTGGKANADWVWLSQHAACGQNQTPLP